MEKQKGKNLTKRSETKKREAAQNQREGASPSPSERRGCERKRWDKKGGDVSGGIRNEVCWGYRRVEKTEL